jgi:hypothetical protein
MVASLSGDDLVDVLRFNVANGDRLEDAEPLHGIDEFLLCVRVESVAWLVGIGTNTVSGDGESTAEAAAAF